MITMNKITKIARDLQVPGRSYLSKARLIEGIVERDTQRKHGPKFLSDALFSNLHTGDIVFLWNSNIAGEVMSKKKKGYARFYRLQLKLLPCDVRKIHPDFPGYKKKGDRLIIEAEQVFIEDRFLRDGKYYHVVDGSIKIC